MTFAICKASFETLESRRLFSVTLNSAGFSVIVPDGNSRAVYVSTSMGSDSNSGLSQSTPVYSLTKAYSLVRNGFDDQILLLRGDTWTASFGQWEISGLSQQFPLLIGTYGSGNRPVIDTGYGNGFIANTSHPVNYIFMQGLQFIANLRDPTETTVTTTAAQATPTGLQLLGPSTYDTIEDCSFTYFKDNIVIQQGLGAITNITIRRSISADSYCTSTSSQGFYATVVNGITLDQDVFDHNGWNANVSGAVITGNNHDIYYSNSASGMIVTNCVLANASCCGVLARSGGTIDNDLFLNDAVGVSFGEANGANSTPGGVVGQIDNNVFMDNHTLNGTALGQGIDIGNIRPASGVTISGNIFADDDEQASPAITLDYATNTNNPSACVGINDLTVSNNIIYGWLDGIQLSTFDDTTPLTTLTNVTITGNQLQSDPLFLVNHQGAYFSAQEHWISNIYYSTYGAPFHLQNTYPTFAGWGSIDPTGVFRQLSYLDSTRTAASYNALLGGVNSMAAFMTREDSQSDLNWSDAYTPVDVIPYLQAGFATSLSVASGQQVVLAYNPSGPAASTIAGLTIAGTTNAWSGKLDLTNNNLDIPGSSLATVTNQIKQGYANGAWTGNGILSSTAASDSTHLTTIGVIQNNQSGTPLFNSTNRFDKLIPGATDVLVKFTYYGDANLDGMVDGSDYTKIDAGYLSHGSMTGWFNGDFNYDTVINGSDYTLIDNAFNTQRASLAAQIGSSAAKPAIARWAQAGPVFTEVNLIDLPYTTKPDNVAARLFSSPL